MSDIDCSGTDEPTCPKCGTSWEPDGEFATDNSEVVECDECGAVYMVTADFTVDYSSDLLSPVTYTDADGNEQSGFCDLGATCYTGAEYLPPDGIGRRVYDRFGRDTLVAIGKVKEAPHA